MLGVVRLRSRCLVSALAGALLAAFPSGESRAEWSVHPEMNFFYTDDAALFSATRRTLKDADPTQPILDFDLTEKNSTFVYEPALEVRKELTLWGEPATLQLRGQGFLFAGRSRFDHGSLAVEARRDFGSRFEAVARYYFSPELFLGNGRVRPLEEEEDEQEFRSERLDAHFWSLGLRYRATERFEAVLLGRAGIRRYERPFGQRDTDFFTAGIHTEFELTEWARLGLAFHYERGLADGRNGSNQERDDHSYHNYFVSGGIALEILPRAELEVAMHYERNDFTTNLDGDERRGEAENSVQGDVSLRYELTEIVDLTAGFQGVYRKETFEGSLRNLNVVLGFRASF